jgi:hypothetical protein
MQTYQTGCSPEEIWTKPLWPSTLPSSRSVRLKWLYGGYPACKAFPRQWSVPGHFASSERWLWFVYFPKGERPIL